jgi:hypothetical protein
MERDELIERLKDTRDPGERGKILEILASLEKEGTSPGNESPGTAPAVKKPVTGVSLGYVVGALFLAGGALMVYNGFIAAAAGSKGSTVLTLLAVGAFLLILGVRAIYRAGRIREISTKPPPGVRGQESDGFRPGP